MKPERCLEKGRLKTIEGSDHRPVSSLAVQVVTSGRGKALIMDGSRTVDPYFMVRECKSVGLEERKILKKIMVSRAFTAYQCKDLVEKVEARLEEMPIIFLGAVALSPLFEDKEIGQEEGRWLRSKLIKRMNELVKEKELYGVIVDPNSEIFQKRNRSGKERNESCSNRGRKKYMNHSNASSIG